MPRKPENRGTCAFCGETLLRRGITKHLEKCVNYQQALPKSNQAAEKIWRVRVQDAYDSDYWLELDMRGTASLTQLDSYLRAIWLECCGHLSEFNIGGWGGMKVAKARKADQVFHPDLVLNHIYDFGTSSETTIRVMQEASSAVPLSKHPITLLARNLPLQFTCQECGQPAAWMCMECQVDHDEPGLLCEKHVKKHPHENYGEPIEIVNSPRMGMCGYSGPAEPPY
ncbi:MAG: plasmid pRiA4b ORF-3 family protein [Anaerolineae bacterium]|nr:plasmid pRiA4b ORF-3 family protein [Anaerolineae bacterium]